MFNELFWMAAADAAQGTTTIEESGSVDGLIGILIVLAVIVFIWHKKVSPKQKAEKREKKAAKKAQKQYENSFISNLQYPHLSGLNLPAGTNCMFRYNESSVVFETGSQRFTMSMQQVMDMSVITLSQMKSQMVSDAGKAVAGGMMFGAVGAMVGGSAKIKNFTAETPCLVITYRSNGEIKQVILDVSSDAWSAKDVAKKATQYYFRERLDTQL